MKNKLKAKTKSEKKNKKWKTEKQKQTNLFFKNFFFMLAKWLYIH